MLKNYMLCKLLKSVHTECHGHFHTLSADEVYQIHIYYNCSRIPGQVIYLYSHNQAKYGDVCNT